ncbi:MAG: hypothetical protein AB9903_28580 [Vulcanimicrobiota bacterium]
MISRNTINISMILFVFVFFSLAALLPGLPLCAEEPSGRSAATASIGGDDLSRSYTVADEGGGEGSHDEHHDEDAVKNGESPPDEHADEHAEAGSTHTHSHGKGGKDECITCDEYWHEPWRISAQSVQWVREKTIKLLIFIVLCYLFLKRKMLFSLLSGRKGSGRPS